MADESVSRRWWDRLVATGRRAATQARASCRAELDRLESRRLLAADVVISEFMAINGTTLADEDGEFSDWIELHNTTAAPVNLNGWHLTDNAGNLDKWTFPDVTLPAGGYMVVFASNKDRAIAGQPLHTDFNLDGDGEYLALVRPDAVTVEYQFAPTYPQQESDLSYGTGPNRATVTPLVPAPSQVKVVVPDATTPANWNTAIYDDTEWDSAATGVGFEIGAGTAGALPQELEPNDSPSAADDASRNFLPVTGSSLYQLRVQGNVNVVGDADFYSLGPLEPGDTLSITQTATSSNRGTLNDSYVELYRAGIPGVPVAVSDDDATGLDSLVHRFAIPTSDTYYVRARAFNDSSTGTYEVSAWLENGGGTPAPSTSGPAAAESEPNNTIATADDLSASWRAAGYLSSTTGAVVPGAGRADHFAYQFTAGDLVTVHVDSTTGLNAAAMWLDSAGSILAIDNGDSSLPFAEIGDVQLLSWRAPATGTYVLAVNGDEDTSGDYRADVYLSTPTAPPAASKFGNLLNTDIRPLMHGVNASAYVRAAFDYTPVPGAATMTLSMHYDDGFVAYLNGVEVARRNAPGGTPAYNAASLNDRPGEQAVVAETINLTAFLPSLVDGRNVLAIHGLNSAANDPEFLLMPSLQVSTAPVVPPPSYFTRATPGAPNNDSQINRGPQISAVTHLPHEPADTEDVFVTAKIGSASGAPVTSVTLKYRAMYLAEVSVGMLDDGAHGDGAAGDGVYGAAIPATAAGPGQMVRYRVEAADARGATSRAPLHQAASSAEYFGFMVRSPSLAASTLPVLNMFSQNIPAAMTRAGTRASVYFDGEFYDNVFVRDRGGNTSDGYKFDFNPGDRFRWWPLPAPGQPQDPKYAKASRVDEINVNYNSALDETRLRASLAFDTYTLAGVPALASFPMRVQRNGTLFQMASFVENPDAEYLARVGLDGDGALYKMAFDNPQMNSAFSFEKLTRRNEGNDDLQQFLDGIHGAFGDPVKYLYDHFDIPGFLNYWAANTIVGDNDDVQKNYLLYRDTNGDGEWQFLPWDKDLTFGKNWGISDYNFQDPQAHPFFGDSRHPKIDGPHAYNYLIDVLLTDPTIRTMYLRRLRTLMDQLLQPSNTPPGDRRMEARVEELWAEVSGDAQVRAQMPNLRNQLNAINTQYIARRRTHLYVDHGTNTAYRDHAGIPAAQAAGLPIDIAEIDFNPASGNQDQEYIRLNNPNAVAVDVSGWTLSGGVAYTVPEGVVIPARGSVFVARDSAAFRARAAGPAGGQGLFVIGGYDGQLSARGETLVLADNTGATIDTFTWPGAPTAAQQALRVTEVMYHPPDAPNNTPVDESFEYIEFQNISGQPLNLNGIRLTQGVNVLLGNVTLQPGEYALVVKDRAAFTSRYGAAAAGRIVGEYPLDILDNGGERLRIEDASGEVVLDFNIDHLWFPSTDGQGRSLTIRNPTAPVGTWGDSVAWRSSSVVNGTPGAPDNGAPTTALVGTRLFYNNSALDGRDAAAGYADDAAVAPDKSGWDGTGSPSAANVSGYDKGINGVMFDVSNLLTGLAAADFAVSMSSPTGWVPAPAPTVTVRGGSGAGESDRVSLLFPDGSVVNRWLRVTMLAKPAAGLTASRTFTFGSLVGDTGGTAATFIVNAADVAGTRSAINARPATAASRFDLNRDGRVNTVDYAIARANQSHRLTAPPAAAAGATTASVFADAPIIETASQSSRRQAYGGATALVTTPT